MGLFASRFGPAWLAVALALSSRLSTAQATVVGTVFDSLFTNAPMRGATVVIPELSRYVTTDARGRFRFDSVPAGSYTMTFLHPKLDSLDIAAEVLPVTVPASGVVNARLATPSPAGVVWLVCRATADTFPAMMLGHVRDADDATAIAGATITAVWSELVLRDDVMQRRTTRSVARTRPSGAYVLCGLPSGLRVEVSASAGAHESGTLAVVASGNALLQRVDVAIGRRDTRSATVTGVVRDARGRPAPRATVVLADTTPVRVRTDDSGRFTMRNVPAGTRRFEARRPGSWPQATAVDVPSAGSREVALALGRGTSNVAPVPAVAPGDSTDDSGFEERRRAGIGRFITAQEIARARLKRLSDALVRLPPLIVGSTVRSPSKAVELLLRAEGKPIGDIVYTPILRMRISAVRSCTPAFYLNGIAWLPELPGRAQLEIQSVVGIEQVRGIEVYPPATIPVLFDRSNGCGSVLVWTQ